MDIDEAYIRPLSPKSDCLFGTVSKPSGQPVLHTKPDPRSPKKKKSLIMKENLREKKTNIRKLEAKKEIT